jgi:hypothetical protein
MPKVQEEPKKPTIVKIILGDLGTSHVEVELSPDRESTRGIELYNALEYLCIEAGYPFPRKRSNKDALKNNTGVQVLSEGKTDTATLVVQRKGDCYEFSGKVYADDNRVRPFLCDFIWDNFSCAPEVKI